jgi:hypothetical protein
MDKEVLKLDTIKRFPGFTTLEIGHRELIEKQLKNLNSEVSELNFTEMYAWHAIRETKLTLHNDNLLVYLKKYGKPYFYPPFGINEPCKTMAAVLECMLKENEDTVFYGFNEAEASIAEHSGRLAAVEDRDNADYVYKQEELATLAGRKFESKRNHLNKFLKNYEFEFLPITGAMIGDVKEFQQKWCEERACDDDLSLINENTALMEVLDNWEKLDVFGAVIKIGGKIQAFTAASTLNNDMAVVLFEKANPEFTGIYQAINQIFCRDMLSKFKWINREQDAGEMGLRKAKLSYNPDHLVNKYIVSLKEE